MKKIYCYFFFVIFLDLFHFYEFQEQYNFIPINGTYVKIKQLPLGEYLVIIINFGIYKYNNDFSKKENLYEFKENEKLYEFENDKITLSEYIYNDNLYIFCLISNSLYLFNYKNTNITKHVLTFNPIGDYYNLIPYKHKNNNLANSFNYIIYYITRGISYDIYYLYFYIYEISTNCSVNEKLFHESFSINFIQNIHCHCQLITINNQYSLICFTLSDFSKRIIVGGFDIKDKTIDITRSYSNEYPKGISSTTKMSIKSILDSNIIYLCYFEYFNYKYESDYKCLIYDYINNTFRESFKKNISDYNENFNIYLFQKSYYITYIQNNNILNIIKISDESNEEKIIKKIDQCENINIFYLIYNDSKGIFSLISDCLTKDEQSNIIYNIPISFFITSSSLEQVKNKTKEEILENPDDVINSIEIGKKYEIKGEDFTLTIQPTNSSFNESSTHIDFSECEKILRQNPNISTSILTILQLEIENKNNNSLVDNLEYLIYDEKKNKVDLSVCKNISTQQYLKLKNDFDLSNYNNYKTSGIDIFNINDLFFNDICHPYLDSETNNDVVLKDRIKDIYQNYTLCNEGCSYTEINTEYKTVSCNCQIKTNISLEDNYTSNSPKLDEIEVDSNFALIKCSNLVFSYKGKSKNAGFWIFLFLVMGNIPMIFLYFYKGIKSIKEHIINEMKKSGYINGDNNNKNEKKLNLSFPPRKSIKMGNNSKLYESSLISNAKGSERQIIGDINNNEDINVNDINNININDDEFKNKINLKKSNMKKDVNKTQRNSRTISKEISNQIFINKKKIKKIKRKEILKFLQLKEIQI